jgi:superfamily II DNA or RNA helicase
VIQSLPDYTRADIVRWLDGFTVEKGAGYLDDVEDLHAEGSVLSGRVQGTAPTPYRVTVRFFREGSGGYRIASDCSCPVRYDCKHVAALLLRHLQRDEAMAPPPPRSPLGVEVARWLGEFSLPQRTLARPARGSGDKLFYLLAPVDGGRWRLSFRKARPTALGAPGGNSEAWSGLARALYGSTPRFLGEEDLALLKTLWHATPPEARKASAGWALPEVAGCVLLERLAATGRLFINTPGRGLAGPLQWGARRPATLVWRRDERALHYADLQISPEAMTVALDAPAYLDAVGGEVGPLDVEGDWPLWRSLLDAPPMDDAALEHCFATLRQRAPGIALPEIQPLPRIEATPIPVLRLDTLDVRGVRGWRQHRVNYRERAFDGARPRFLYDAFLVTPGNPSELAEREDGTLVQLMRDRTAEARWLAELAECGLEPVPDDALYLPAHEAQSATDLYGLESAAAWDDFMVDALPRLAAAGWRVEIEDRFRHWAPEPDDWIAELAPSEGGEWLDLGLAVEVDGVRLPLAPMLADLVQREPHWLRGDFRGSVRDEAGVMLLTESGKRLRVPAGRIKPLLAALTELFDRPGQSLRVSRLDARRVLDALGDRWKGDGLAMARRMAEKLREAGQVQPVAPPTGFGLTLRPYQQQGLAWLQYLREHELAGILADDMGLGKTAQALAHLLLEKESGRADRPSLVVLPTSLVHNWQTEAARFAPALRVLALQGAERVDRFEAIPAHDLVLTTYPLLWRDIDALRRHDYHLLILDEAQTVKNAASRSAAALRQLRARHRLAMTGTPLENHLGELWAQFDFLLPGFLGDSRSFTRLWRTPIERHRDTDRRALLARRLKPFILRRRKDEVATELPPKTVVIHEVVLEGRQRELYETVRAAMDRKVREAVAAQGFARSQIVILDALLKLRQVCNDPRLVKSEAAQRVKERAKMDALMAMLPELVEEGRRILVFSQFTGMLDLIAAALHEAGLDFVTLTGDTRDRATPVARFQAGEVSIFLISLKAGGVGLNLTTADTVIHVDPWWNPAAEQQATDRAHRIGQTKPVFVYKLIAAGSIEERILALQEKKAALAAGVLQDDTLDGMKFDEMDLAALLAPLPERG